MIPLAAFFLAFWLQAGGGELINRIGWEVDAVKKDVVVLQERREEDQRRISKLENEMESRLTASDLFDGAVKVSTALAGLFGAGWALRKYTSK